MHIQQAHKTTEQEHTAVVTAILFEAVVTAILSEAVVTARWSPLGTLQPMWRILVCANKKACTLGHPCIYCSHEEIVSSTSRASNWCRRQQPASFSPPPCKQNEREREREREGGCHRVAHASMIVELLCTSVASLRLAMVRLARLRIGLPLGLRLALFLPLFGGGTCNLQVQEKRRHEEHEC